MEHWDCYLPFTRTNSRVRLLACHYPNQRTMRRPVHTHEERNANYSHCEKMEAENGCRIVSSFRPPAPLSACCLLWGGEGTLPR